MKIKLLKPMARDGQILEPGATLDLPDRQAEFFVQGGWAEAVQPEHAPVLTPRRTGRPAPPEPKEIKAAS